MSIINKEISDFKASAFHENEFKTVTKDDILGKWSVFFFYPADFTFICPTELEDLANKYDEFRNEGTLVIIEGTILDMMEVYEELVGYIENSRYTVESVGYDPYYAKEFIERWEQNNWPFGIVKVPQGARTESVPLGEIKKLAEDRMLIFDQQMMSFTMGNCITLEDTNGNRKLFKKRHEQKIDSVAALMDALVAYKLYRDAFE